MLTINVTGIVSQVEKQLRDRKRRQVCNSCTSRSRYLCRMSKNQKTAVNIGTIYIQSALFFVIVSLIAPVHTMNQCLWSC